MEPTIELLTGRDHPAFAAAATVFRADTAEHDPDDPPPSDDYVAGDLFVVPPDRRRCTLVASAGTEPLGYLCATVPTNDTLHQRLAEIEIHVLAEHRRQGIATALVERVLPMLVELGATSVIGYPCVDDDWAPGAVELCTKFGLTRRQDVRCSRVRAADVDEALLQRWIDDAATRAARYRVECWEGRCPPDLAEAWAVAADAMADAPLDDVEEEHHTRTPDELDAADAALVEEGFRVYRSLALRDAGDPAGMTAIYLSVGRPEVAFQGDTGVLAAHRGHGLGRWLKALNYRQAIAAHPEIAVVQTFNAQSNPWMLDINVAMGFRPHHIYAAFQAPMDEVAARVG